MAEDGLVSADELISDESSFYGDEVTTGKLESKAPRLGKRKREPFHQKTGVGKTRQPCVPQLKPEPNNSASDVLEYLKTLPQQHVNSRKPESSTASEPRSTREAAAVDVHAVDPTKHDEAAWQQSETIDEFLGRVPVADPATCRVGPWLWVEHPTPGNDHHPKADIALLVRRGKRLLEDFDLARTRAEGRNSEGAQLATTRDLKLRREQLENDLLSLAIETNVTCGKWMLFPTMDDIARSWRLVAQCTAAGKLGPVSKVGTYTGQSNNLICVYTHDFSDTVDVRRVLDQLVELGFCADARKPLYYKCDAYTYLGIDSKNVSKLRASLFSSSRRDKISVLELGFSRQRTAGAK